MSSTVMPGAGAVSPDLRDAPTSEFIAEMRERFPTEREIDRMLTRKLERRAGPPYAAVGLDTMAGHVRRFLDDHIEGPFEVTDARWLSGGASKIQLAFTLSWDEPGVGPTTTKLVARMEPNESLNTTSRMREYQVVRALEGTVPVPHAYWVDDDGDWFPEPTLIYDFVEGVTKPTMTQTGKLTGLGTNFGPALRERLGEQFIEHLARIHTFDPGSATLDSFDVPAVGTSESALWQLNRARRVWEEDRGEDLPIVEVAASWLEANLPVLDRVSVVHGDYRSGNFLFDERDDTITAWLDWERGYLGDRHRDLAWTSASVFGHYAEDGKTYLVCGLVPRDEFFSRYEAASGLTIDPDRLRYYSIFNRYQIIASTLGTAYRVIRLGKSHQDVLLARLEGAVYMMADELRVALNEVL